MQEFSTPAGIFAQFNVAPETQSQHSNVQRVLDCKTYCFGPTDASLGANAAASLSGGSGRCTIGRIDGLLSVCRRRQHSAVRVAG